MAYSEYNLSFTRKFPFNSKLINGKNFHLLHIVPDNWNSTDILYVFLQITKMKENLSHSRLMWPAK